MLGVPFSEDTTLNAGIPRLLRRALRRWKGPRRSRISFWLFNRYDKMKISVIVPVYNMEKRLPRCIESLRRQTYADLEIILVNDGSEDGSLSLCRHAAEQDRRISVLDKKNGGVSSARNMGLASAQGDWICFVDPDDYLKSFEIGELLAAAGPETDIVCGDFTADDGGRMVAGRFFAEELDARSADSKRVLYCQLMDSFYGQDRKSFYTAVGVPWAKIYRRELLAKNGLRFDEQLSWNEDNIFNMRAFFDAREVRYRHIDGYCYDYDHSGRMMHTYQPDFQKRVRKAAEARRECLEETGLIRDGEIARAYVNEMVNYLAGALKRSVFHRDHRVPFDEKVREVEQLMRTPEFSFLFEKKDAPAAVSGRKNRIFVRLLRNRQFRLVQLFLER